MEDYVSYDQALRLKELGFNWKCNHWYNFLKELKTTDDYYSGNEWSFQKTPAHADAPTLSQAAKWLREVKGIVILVDTLRVEGEIFYWKICDSKGFWVDSSVDNSETYEQALSLGIDKALELLK